MFLWIHVVFFLVLLISNAWIYIFFKSLLKMRITLSEKLLERKRNNKKEKFEINDICRIKIKKTTKGHVREIYVDLKNKKNIIINGLENFDKFVESLIEKVNKKAIIKYIYEPLDFDSIFFYPTLGIILSFFTVYLFRFLATLDEKATPIVLYGLLTYIFLVVAYFVISKPISKRY